MHDESERVRCRFGSERFDVYSDPEICMHFEREFHDPDPSCDPDAVFTISRQGRRGSSAKENEEAGSNGEGIRYSNRKCDFVIRFGTPLKVDVALKRSAKMSLVSRLPVFAQRLLTRKFNSVDEQEYGYLVYKAVLWVLFLHSINSSRLFLHASGFVRDGRCVLLCGTGGVGKTSLSAKILAKKETLFVSDDIVTVSLRGVAYANGMYVHAYPYNNLETSLPFQSLKGSMAWLNRCHWNIRKVLLGPKGACRRISPFELHRCDAASATGNELAAIVWLSRDGSNESGIRRADGQEFAISHKDVLREEVQSAFDFYATATENGWDPGSNGMPVNLDKAILDGLNELTDRVPIWRFNVAENRSAEQNADALLGELEEQWSVTNDASSTGDDDRR